MVKVNNNMIGNKEDSLMCCNWFLLFVFRRFVNQHSDLMYWTVYYIYKHAKGWGNRA